MPRRSSRLATAIATPPPAQSAPQPAAKSTNAAKTAANPKSAPSKTSIATKPKATARNASLAAAADLPMLPFPDAAAFKAYMLQVGVSVPGIWLRIAKKSTMIPTVTYEEALDEALCCGWIDGQRKPLDAQYFLQRFTPRRRKSNWSQRNVDKIAMLIEAGRMTADGQAEVDAAKEDGRWARAYAGAATIEVPPDFRAALDARPRAARAFDALTKAARYPYLYRLCTVKKEETRERKIAEFVEALDEED